MTTLLAVLLETFAGAGSAQGDGNVYMGWYSRDDCAVRSGMWSEDCAEDAEHGQGWIQRWEEKGAGAAVALRSVVYVSNRLVLHYTNTVNRYLWRIDEGFADFDQDMFFNGGVTFDPLYATVIYDQIQRCYRMKCVSFAQHDCAVAYDQVRMDHVEYKAMLRWSPSTAAIPFRWALPPDSISLWQVVQLRSGVAIAIEKPPSIQCSEQSSGHC